MSLTTVDSRYGKIVVDTNDKYLSRSLIEYGEFSEGEASLFKQLIQPHFTVLDIGANFGAHTLLFSRLAQEVFCFEPQRYVFDALMQTIKLNDLQNVVAICAAICDGKPVKYRDVDTSQENNFGASSFVGVTEGEDMPTYTLEGLPCHFLKIDVEGMEMDVLKGAEKMIREYCPIIYIENDRPDQSDALIAELESLGYDCYWDTPPLFNANNFFGKKENIFPGLASVNMLCVAKGCQMNGVRAKAGDWHKIFHQNAANVKEKSHET